MSYNDAHDRVMVRSVAVRCAVPNGLPSGRNPVEKMIESEAIFECQERLPRGSIGERRRRCLVRLFSGSQPDVQIPAENAGTVRELREQRLHLPRPGAIAGKGPLPPARAILEMHVDEQQVHPRNANRCSRRDTPLPFARKLNRLRVHKGQRRHDRVAALDASHAPRRGEEPVQACDAGVRRRFLQQEHDFAESGATGQSAGAQICNDRVEVSGVSVKVPGDDDEVCCARRDGNARVRRRARARGDRKTQGQRDRASRYATAAFLAAARSVAAERNIESDV